MTVPAQSRHLVNRWKRSAWLREVRGHELLERLRNGRVKPAGPRKPGRQHGFEQVEPRLGTTDFRQMLPHGSGSLTPQVSERRVSSRQLVGRDPEQRLGRAWTKLGANGAERPRDLPYVERIPRTADD